MLGGFLHYPGYRNVFACMECNVVKDPSLAQLCFECGSYACEHLFEMVGEFPVCFGCIDLGDDADWPDWCFTMLPHEEKRGRNG